MFHVLSRVTGATFPAGFDRGLAIDLKSYDAEFDTTVIFEIEFHENNNIFYFPPRQAQT